MSSADAAEAAGAAGDDLEGVLLHPTYPASLEREGFIPYRGVDSPSFELRAVSSGVPDAAAQFGGSGGGGLKHVYVSRGSSKLQGAMDAADAPQQPVPSPEIGSLLLRRRSASVSGGDD